MASLDDLLALDGVVAAGEFGRDGSLKDHKANMDMSPELAAGTAQFCASVTMLFDVLAGAYGHIARMNWLPQRGWAFSGGDWTVAVGGNKGVFVKTAEADFNRLFEVLVGPR